MNVSENLEVWSKNIRHFYNKMRGGNKVYYGDQWGLPEHNPRLNVVLQKFLLPFVDDNKVCLEIGSGGGRWTQYLKGFRKLYATDINPDMIEMLQDRFTEDTNIEYLLSNGTDYPGVQDKVDFVFSFDVFVHIDPLEIHGIFQSLKPLLNEDAKGFIHYSDQDKEAAGENVGFSRNNPDLMRCMIEHSGYRILEEDFSLNNSSLVVFTNS